jgi:hypothetical protein
MGARNYSHLNANGTTTLASTPVELHTVTINTKGASANTLTLSDGANTIAVIDTTTGTETLTFDCQCRSGLTAVLATGTAADVTICFG